MEWLRAQLKHLQAGDVLLAEESQRCDFGNSFPAKSDLHRRTSCTGLHHTFGDHVQHV